MLQWKVWEKLDRGNVKINQKNKIQESLVTMLSFSLKQKFKLDREINEELWSKEKDFNNFNKWCFNNSETIWCDNLLHKRKISLMTFVFSWTNNKNKTSKTSRKRNINNYGYYATTWIVKFSFKNHTRKHAVFAILLQNTSCFLV